MLCDISKGDIQIGPDAIQCNSIDLDNSTHVIVIGASSTHRISILNYQVTLELSNITITSDHPFIINDSNVTIIFTESNTIQARSGSAVACNSSSIELLSKSSTAVLTATAVGDSAAVGAGIALQCNSLTIRNGTYLIRSDAGSGIGTSGGVNSSMGTITVIDGVFSIETGAGAGIGTGSGSSSVHSILINNGTYSIASAKAAAIGTSQTHSSRIVDLIIRNGTFTLHGSIGVGSQHSNGVGRLYFHRDRAHDFTIPLFINCSATDNVCLDAEHMEIQDCPIAAITTTKQFLGGDIHVSVGMSGGVPRLYAQFASVSQNENVTGCHLLHFGDIDLGDATGVCRLTVVFPHNSPGKFDFNSVNRGLMIELAPAAAVTVDFDCPNKVGSLCWGNADPSFPTVDGEAFFDRVFVCPGPSSSPVATETQTSPVAKEGFHLWVALVGAGGGLFVILAVFVVVGRYRREGAFNKFDDQSQPEIFPLAPHTQITPDPGAQ
jgi:hypothetical protein